MQIYTAPFCRSRSSNPGWPVRPRAAVLSNGAALLSRNLAAEVGDGSSGLATRTPLLIRTVTAGFRCVFPATSQASEPVSFATLTG